MDMPNIEGCLVCNSKDSSHMQVTDPGLLNNILHYLHSVLSRDSTARFEFVRQHQAVYICRHCYDFGSKLINQETEMWKRRKQMLDSTIEFNMSVLLRRVKGGTQNNGNITLATRATPMPPMNTTRNQQTAAVNYGVVGTSASFVRSQPNHGSQVSESTYGRVPVGSGVEKKGNENASQQSQMNQVNENGGKGMNKETNEFRCHKCLTEFPTKLQLDVHYQINKGKVVYLCRFCPKVFPYRHIFERHVISHFNVKWFECHLCPKKYKHELSLKAHQRIHNGTTFRCTYCGKSFVEKRYLRDHERIHTGNKLQCSQCEKSFVNKQGLAIHTAKHAGKKLKCSFCDKLFFEKYALRRHEKTHQPQQFVASH